MRWGRLALEQMDLSSNLSLAFEQVSHLTALGLSLPVCRNITHLTGLGGIK